MSKLIIHPNIRVSHSPYGGLGVFTDVDIKEGEGIEQCYGLIIKNEMIGEEPNIPSLLRRYVYKWEENDLNFSVVLTGFGMIYNHSKNDNVIYIKQWLDVDGDSLPFICFIAKKDIKAGEELLINYGEDYFKIFNISEIE